MRQKTGGCDPASRVAGPALLASWNSKVLRVPARWATLAIWGIWSQWCRIWSRRRAYSLSELKFSLWSQLLSVETVLQTKVSVIQTPLEQLDLQLFGDTVLEEDFVIAVLKFFSEVGKEVGIYGCSSTEIFTIYFSLLFLE